MFWIDGGVKLSRRRLLGACGALLMGLGYPGVAGAADELVPVEELGSYQPLPKPTLQQAGGRLVLSDSPETLADAAQLPAVLYRDRVEGRCRVFYHHQNLTGRTLLIGTAVHNPTDRPAWIVQLGEGIGVDQYPDVAGQRALASFLRGLAPAHSVRLLPPGGVLWALHPVEHGSTISGWQELWAVDAPSSQPPARLPRVPQGLRPAGMLVATLACLEPPAGPLTELPVLPGDEHTRGTFQHADRLGRLEVGSAGGLQRLSVGTAAPGHPYSDPMPGEYELGYDAVEGRVVDNNGNYGVIYHLQVELVSAQPGRELVFALLMQPSGGFGHYVMEVDGQLELSPFVSYRYAWLFHRARLRGRRTRLEITTALPGGAFGPQTLYFYPGYAG